MKKRQRYQGVGEQSVHTPATPFFQHPFRKTVTLLHQSPRVFLTREAYEHMYHIVDLAEKEIGWLGSVEQLPEGDFLIRDVILFQQEVSWVQTKITTEGLSEMAKKIIAERPNDGIEYLNSLRFWGHSHVRMVTEPSTDDDLQMDVFSESGHPWFIRGILNKNGSMTFTVYLYDSGIKLVDVEWAIWEPVRDNGMRARVQQELTAKVTEQKIPKLQLGRDDVTFRETVPSLFSSAGFHNGIHVVEEGFHVED